MMNTPVIKSALEMGFERSLVKQTVQSKILTSGENYRTVQELVSDLLSAEDQKREEEREMLAEAMASGTWSYIISCRSCSNLVLAMYVALKYFFVPDGFTFVKRHQAALIQRLKSVEPVLEHLREQNVLCKWLYFTLLSRSVLNTTASLDLTYKNLILDHLFPVYL